MYHYDTLGLPYDFYYTIAKNEREADGKQRYNVDDVDRRCRA